MNNFIIEISETIELIPLWAYQIIGAYIITQFILQVIKGFEPRTWSPYKRRKFNLALSIIIGGAAITYLYNGNYKDFVVVAFMFGNNFLYSGLSKFVEHKAKKNNGFWTIMLSFFKPHIKKKHYVTEKNDILKVKDSETDKTIMTFNKKSQD